MSLMFISVGLMHGDMSQMERNEVITSFKKKEMPILVATDVAGNQTDMQTNSERVDG